MQIPLMPFKILALAPFRFNDDTPWTQPPISIEGKDLDAAMDALGVTGFFSVSPDVCPAGGLDVRFSKLKDFHPDALVQNNTFLKHLLEAKRYFEDPNTRALSSSDIQQGLKQWPDLPLIQVKSGKDKATSRSASTVDSILDMVALPEEDSDLSPKLHAETDQINYILQQTLNHIFNHEAFRASEAAWRGLKLLLQHGAGDKDSGLAIVPTSLHTLEETLENLIPNLINDLPSLILIDLPFDNSPFCVGLLEKIGQFAETLMVPAMVWITPRFMQLESWDGLNKLPFLPNYLEEPAFAKWRGLKDQPSANWLAVTCNQFLTRYPYGTENMPRKSQFREHLKLWTGPVWALASLIAQSFIKTGWPTRFADWQEIRIEDLPVHAESTSKPIPLEISLTEDRIDQFLRAGIIPLAAIPNKDVAFVPAETTIADASLSYQLFVSRITQFILWCRDHLAKDLEGADLEVALRRAFEMFWERSGLLGPEHLEITAGPSQPDGRIPLHIELKPSRKILYSSEKMVLDFSW
jgi:type VI secretion system protein ImpC